MPPAPLPPAFNDEPAADALQAAMDRASLDEDARAELLTWLGEQLAEERFAQLDRAGHDPNDRIPLARVLVDLPIARSPMVERNAGGNTIHVLQALCAEDATLFEPAPSARRGMRGAPMAEGDFLDAGCAEGRGIGASLGVVLVGGPGQGKSTITQSLCAVHHAALLDSHAGPPSGQVREAVESIRAAQERSPDGPEGLTPLPTPSKVRFPLRIVLPEAAAWLLEQGEIGDPNVPALVAFAAARGAKTPVRATMLMALLPHIDWLVVLDGLDEVPASEARTRVLAEARRLLDWLQARVPGGLVAATTRPQGYGGELDRWAEMQTWYLVPLEEAEAKGYARQLVRARFETKRGDRILARLSEAAAAPAAARLLRTPLQVTILVALIARIGRAPGERWSLFSEYYRIIYEREMERDLPAAELLRRYRPFIDRIHAHVGLLLQAEAEQASGTDATMTTARLRDVMHAVFADQGMDAARRQPVIEELLSAITERLVLLVERRAGHVGFEIRPLQELMAAWALAQKEALIEERLLRVARSNAYREVVLFLASKAFAELSDVRDVLVDRVLPAMNEDVEEPLAAMVLRGSVLAVEVLEDGAALSQPKYVERLASLAVRLIDLPPNRALPRLARACMADPDAAGAATPVLLAAITQRLDAGGPLDENLSSWCLLIAMADRGSETAGRMVRDRFTELIPRMRVLVSALQTTTYFASESVSRAVAQSPEKFDPDILIDNLGAGNWRLTRALFAIYGGVGAIGLRIGRPEANVSLHFRWSSIGLPRADVGLVADLDAQVPALRPVVAAARFLLDPGPEALAAALDYVAAAGEQACDGIQLDHLPWPLAACLATSHDPGKLRSLAQEARAGNLGDLETWRVAEQNCSRARIIPMADLLSSCSSGWPGNGPLVGIPLPLAAAHVGVAHTGTDTHLRMDEADIISAISKLRGMTIPPAASRVLANGILMLLEDRARCGQAVKLSVDDARVLWSLRGTLPLLALNVTNTWTAARRDWLDFLDSLGRSDQFEFGFLPPREVLRFVAAGFEEDPLRTGLLRILAASLSLGMPVEVASDLLAPSRYTDRRDQDAATLLRISQGRASPSEAEDAAVSLLAFAGPDYAPINTLASVALQCADTTLRRALLRGLLRMLPASAWSERFAVIGNARALLGETPTLLDDPAVWDALQFPMPRPERRSSSDRAPSGPVERRPAVLDALSFRNFRGIEELHISPVPPRNGDGQWTVLLGRNGVGKTTILRGLALALFDIEDPVRRPLPPTAYNSAWRRIGASPDDPAFVRVKLRGHEREQGAEIRPRPDLLSPEQLKPIERPPNEMVFAYGVRRRFLIADLKRAVLPELYALVPSLFEEGADLLPIEESLSPLESAWHTDPESVEGRLHLELRAALQQLLRVDKIELRGQDLWVQGDNLGDVPLKELSDGYLTLAAWVVDLVLRWWNQAKRWGIKPQGPVLPGMTGLVLIDEIDLFLHPEWQRSVIRMLKDLFPRMSFVVTTHNPLAILGARAEEIWVLLRDARGGIHAEQREQEPFRLTGSDLYDFYFGIESTLPDEVGQMLYRYRQVGADPFRSPAEDAEAKKLLADLRARDMDPGWEPVPLEEVPPMPKDLA